MTHELSAHEVAILRSNRQVWKYINSRETQQIHRGGASCVEDIYSKYPKQRSRDARVNLLAAFIMEVDPKVREMAKELGETDQAFCHLCAIAALDHHGGDFPCKEKAK